MTALLTRREVFSGLLAVPALATLLKSTRAAAEGMTSPKLCFLYFGNGMHPQWAPPANGESFGALGPMLAPLEAIRSDLVMIKNATMMSATGAGHAMSALATLTGVNARNQPQNSGLCNNCIYNPWAPSLDQVLASRIAAGPSRTPIASLQVGNLVLPFTAENAHVISFSDSNPVVPVPCERDPFKAYLKVVAQFDPGGSGGPDPKIAEERLANRQSVLDGIRTDVARLNARVSSKDRAQLDAYLTALRGLEQGFIAEATPPPPGPAPVCPMAPPAPIAGPLTLNNLAALPTYLKRHLDVVAFALGCGLTNVATVQFTDGSLNYAAPWLGLSTNTHSSSHYAAQPNPTVALAEMATLQAYWLSEVVGFVNKLRAMPDAGGGTVLDHSMVVTTTQNGDSQPHAGANTPVFIAGTGGGKLKTGGRLLDAQGRYHNDIHVALAHAMGFTSITTHGTPAMCNGPLPGLLA